MVGGIFEGVLLGLRTMRGLGVEGGVFLLQAVEYVVNGWLCQNGVLNGLKVGSLLVGEKDMRAMEKNMKIGSNAYLPVLVHHYITLVVAILLPSFVSTCQIFVTQHIMPRFCHIGLSEWALACFRCDHTVSHNRKLAPHPIPSSLPGHAQAETRWHLGLSGTSECAPAVQRHLTRCRLFVTVCHRS